MRTIEIRIGYPEGYPDNEDTFLENVKMLYPSWFSHLIGKGPTLENAIPWLNEIDYLKETISFIENCMNVLSDNVPKILSGAYFDTCVDFTTHYVEFTFITDQPS